MNTITMSYINLLTKRETDVIKLIAEGLSSKDIAKNLQISVNTVKGHRKNILTKAAHKKMTLVVIEYLKIIEELS